MDTLIIETPKSTTRKVFIEHLDKMKPLKFLELTTRLMTDFGGILSNEKIEITEKIDGSALRIGQDQNGLCFIESSTSPSTFNVGEFTERALKKGYTDSIGKHFDNILREVKMDKDIQSILTKFNHGKGIKIIGEILYTPMGTSISEQIRFIRIAYDKDKLGSEWTFVPFNVVDMDGNQHPHEQEVKTALCKISSATRKYVEPKLQFSKDIDISIDIKAIHDSMRKYKQYEMILTSRKKIDSIQKFEITTEISFYQQKLGKKILDYVETGLFGSNFEGIVLKFNDGSLLKLVTEQFKQTEFISL